MKILFILFSFILILSSSAKADEIPSLVGLELADASDITNIDFIPPQKDPIAYENNDFYGASYESKEDWTMFLTKPGGTRIETDVESKLLFVGFQYQFDN
jgi:hypothetical protein